MLILLASFIFILCWKPPFLTSEWLKIRQLLQGDLIKLRLGETGDLSTLQSQYLLGYEEVYQEGLEEGRNLTDPLKSLMEQVGLMAARERLRRALWQHLQAKLVAGLVICGCIRGLWSGVHMSHPMDLLSSLFHLPIVILGLLQIQKYLAVDWFHPGARQRDWLTSRFLQRTGGEHKYLADYEDLELQTGHSYLEEKIQRCQEYADNLNKDCDLNLQRKAELVPLFEVGILVPSFVSLLVYPFLKQVPWIFV